MSLLRDLWWTGVRAVDGRRTVRDSLHSQPCEVTEVVAIGKAASSMCLGAFDALGGPRRSLIVTKVGHVDRELVTQADVECIESGHPIPNARSLVAGVAVRDRIRTADQLLLLVSGGASALVELLIDGVDLQDLISSTDRLLAQDADIAAINAWRRSQSIIKGGLLLKQFTGRCVTVLAISDVPGDGIDVIGSGIGAVQTSLDASSAKVAQSRIVGSNRGARKAIEDAARRQSLPVCCNEQALHAPLNTLVTKLADELISGPNGLYIWGGEPTLELPPTPGVGGRNQSLVVALWAELAQRQLQASARVGVARAGEDSGTPRYRLLVAGTDGTDGPTDAAGGELELDGTVTATHLEVARQAVRKADAGSYLAARESRFVTGPTGTNVMDIALCVKR